MPKPSRTSNSTQIWDKFIGSSRESIPITHLPTRQVVLQRYRCIRALSTSAGLRDSKDDIIDQCWQELSHIWEAARVPTIDDKNAKRKIKALIGWFKGVSSNKRYLEEKYDRAIDAHKYLQGLFDLAPRNIESIMKASLSREWKTDYAFYENQKCYPQTQMMDQKDKKTADIEKRREERKKALAKRRQQEEERALEQEVTDLLDQEEEGEDGQTYQDPHWLPPSSLTTKRPKTISVEMNVKTIFANTTEAAIRTRVSASTHLELLSSFVNQCTTTNTESLTASLSTCKRQRKEKVKSVAKKIQRSFQAPKYPTIHFDGKVVKHMSGEVKDHEAVCLSAPTDLQQPQFLGAPQIEPATGANMARATCNVLNEWEIPIGSLFASVWDTTSVNTGVHNGACACIEREKGSALLWCACRHHVCEIHMTRTFNTVRGTTNGMYL